MQLITFGCLKINFGVGSSVRHGHLGDGLARGGAAELCEPAVLVWLPGSDRNLDPGWDQSVSAERFDLGAPQWPGRERCGGRVVIVNGGNGKQRSTRSDQAADVGDGLAAGRRRAALNGDDLDDQVVGAQPGLRVIEQVSDDVPDGGAGEALPGWIAVPEMSKPVVSKPREATYSALAPRPQPTTTARWAAPESSCALAPLASSG